MKKKVSSSKVPNDGRKGPTSGNVAGNMAISPVVISFPFPKKGKKEKQSKKKQQKHLKKGEKINRKERREGKKQPRASEAHPAVNAQQRRETIEDVTDSPFILSSDEVVQRMRREADDEEFTEEEKQLRDEWLSMDDAPVEHASRDIPSRETVSFVPPNLRYIRGTDAFDALFVESSRGADAAKLPSLSFLSRDKRSLDEEDEEEASEDVEQDDDLMSQNHHEEDAEEINSRVIEKRDVTDYEDDVTEFNNELFATADDQEDLPRDMRTRDVSMETEYGDDVTEVIDDAPSAGGFMMEPIIRHTIVTRDAPSNEGRSVRFE